MNPRIAQLHAYPFERLRCLLADLQPNPNLKPIDLGIGEPRHATPSLIHEGLRQNFDLLGKYPPTAGMPALRNAIAAWIERRYSYAIDPDTSVLPVAGTREALFSFGQAVLDPSLPGAVVMPNPFYQIYEGTTLLAGAKPIYLSTWERTNFKPDLGYLSEQDWSEVRLAFVCSPGNPSGAVMDLEDWKLVFELSERHGFVIAADECYSEIYNGAAPLGAFEAAKQLGRGLTNLVVFNSLSKRSSAAGLRSGFLAGDPQIIKSLIKYRSYHGAAPSSTVQMASVAAWNDEAHVQENRAKYRAKFQLAKRLLPQVLIPPAGFFLWIKVPDDEAFAREAYRDQALTTLPGSYLSRPTAAGNPGTGYIRVALVAEIDECEEALTRLGELLF